MNTKKVETKVYTEHLYCECGGEMKQVLAQFDESGVGILTSVATWPPTYYHYCDKCDRREPLHETYPRIVYEEVEGETVRHGEWIMALYSEKCGNAYCSECNHFDWSNCKYCSECGAKMDGGKE